VAVLYDRPIREVSPELLYRILQLRSAVFVVEQSAAYLDLDGRDLEPSARLLWFEDGDGSVLATARVLDDGSARRIGRIATDPAHRGQGLAAGLVDHFVASFEGPWRLDAQTYLTDWYRSFGFEVDGDEYVDDDGIPHVPMVRRS
jgi:ElaA protein